MYFGKSMKKIRKILKEENIVVNSNSNSDEKNILKFVTYELENGQKHHSIIDNNYVENIHNAKKFLSKFQRIANSL